MNSYLLSNAEAPRQLDIPIREDVDMVLRDLRSRGFCPVDICEDFNAGAVRIKTELLPADRGNWNHLERTAD
jgi:hypothetical protein